MLNVIIIVRMVWVRPKILQLAEAPESQFDLAPEQCINQDILVNNTTIEGSYPTVNGECAEMLITIGEVKKPSFSDFFTGFITE